jgi:hypothetical protein
MRWSCISGQVTDGTANNVKLLLTGADEPEPILKALPVSNLGAKNQRLRRVRELQLQLDKFTQCDVTSHSSAQTAFTEISGASVQGSFCVYHQTKINQKSFVLAGDCPCSGCRTFHR